MKILILTHSFNSLSQRLWLELTARGHEVYVEFDINDEVTWEAIALCQPELVLAPFLKRRIPERVWRSTPCLVVHPGPEGDRGPSALDWAVLDAAQKWGVTLLQAEAELDAGPVWATAEFPMRGGTKSSLYRHEVTEAAVECVLQSLDNFRSPHARKASVQRWRPFMRQADRAIDWAMDTTETILRKIRSGDGNPGVLDEISGSQAYLFDASSAPELSGQPGALVARDETAVYRATVDGAVRIGQMRMADRSGSLKLPAVKALGQDPLARLGVYGANREIVYEEHGGVGLLKFDFYNGAMSTEQCTRLADAYRRARERDTEVLVLFGGSDFWSNGIHLNVIENAPSPADESWRNINAMNDLVLEIVKTERKVTIAALGGNAGAGGVFLALATDLIWARSSVVLNPHYKSIGNLYGSEYWTYLLPRRVGADAARKITEARLPVGANEARRLRLVDEVFHGTVDEFSRQILRRAHALVADTEGQVERLKAKALRRAADEAAKPLARYRADELDRMRMNFYGFDPSYHVARYNFVYKVPKSRTPLYLAHHRRRG